MEKEWDMKAWKPTTPMQTVGLPKEVLHSSSHPSPQHRNPQPVPANNQQDLDRNVGIVTTRTRQILNDPHNPSYWIERADALLHVGYPELTAGDAKKACLLLEAALNRDESDLGEDVKRTFGQYLRIKTADKIKNSTKPKLWTAYVNDCLDGLLNTTYRVSLKAVEFALNPWEALQICQGAKTSYPDDKYFQEEFRVYKRQFEKARKSTRIQGLDAKEANRQLTQGRIFLRQYPFVPAEYLRRSESLINGIKVEFVNASSNCKLAGHQASNIRNANSRPPDSYGVFASSNLAAGDLLFVDPTMIGTASTLPTSNELICEACCGTISPDAKGYRVAECCSAIYCSRQCQTRALASYHKVLCNQDFTWLIEASKPANHSSHPGLDGRAWLRVLSLCVQSDCHPLEHPLLARLTPQYESTVVNRWSFKWNVEIPIKILRQLGIDVWADQRFDTWILQTVWARLINNRNVKIYKGRAVYGVNPLFSFFNHSCEPNATWETNTDDSVGGTTVNVEAIRPIKKDEEVLISYCYDAGGDAVTSLAKDERRKLLMPWLGGDCECSKCLRES